MKNKQEKLLKICQEYLEPFGFDLMKPFNVHQYNNLYSNPKNQLKNFPERKEKENTLGILFGNTKNLWKPFMKEFDLNLKNELNPLDKYTENVFYSLQKKLGNEKSFIKFSHDVLDGEVISIQKICQISGLAYNEESIGLCIHEKFGPWFALRCVLVFDEDFNEDVHQITKFPGSNEDLINMRNEIKYALKTGNWLNIRNCCKLGEEFKYTKEQIDYHYFRKI